MSPERIRVLQFTWRLSPAGGIPATVRDALRAMDRDTFELHACTARPLLPEDHLEELPGVQLHSLGLRGRVSRIRQARAALELARLIEAVRPHVFHTHSGMGWYSVPWRMTHGRRTPAVLEIHDGPSSRRVSRPNLIVERTLLRRLGFRALVHSTAVRDDVLGHTGLRPDRSAVIPIGIDTDRFDRPLLARGAWRTANGFSMDAPLVVYVARLVATKNVDLFIDAAEAVSGRHPGTHFLLVGSGPEQERLLKTIRSRRLSDVISVMGSRDDLVDIYHASDVFLSSSDYEGFGIAVLEAMAAGLPVVSTAVGGVVDLVQDGATGFLVPPRSLPQLVDRVVGLVGDQAQARRLGAEGRTRARQHFDVRTMATAYEAFYRDMAGA